jgi:DNA (cytosine-5)-methyltransferase 1
MIKVGTFFSGIGSPEQALVNLGIEHEIEFACDIDKYARETYLKNFPCKKMYDDITTLDMKDLSYVDLLVFGFPCQAFSLAGLRGGFDDTRGTLFYNALNYLIEHRPRYFIAENVKGLVNHEGGKTLRTILDCLSKTENNQFSIINFDNLGYHVHYEVLNTKDFGVPQNRERIFIVGIRDDQDNNFRFPKGKPLELRLKDILQKKVDSKYFLSERMVQGIFKSNFQERKPMDINKISKCIKVGGDIPCFVDEVVQLNKSKESHNQQPYQQNRVYAKEGISPALSANLGGERNHLINTKNIRRLTPIECERLQGFPDNHTEGVSDTQRYKQCGNSITVDVIQAILNNLIK